MDFLLCCWIFAVAITLHNLEEAVWLPKWSQSAGRWHNPVGEREFRFAVSVLTLLAYVGAYLAATDSRESVGAYFMAGYAFTMLMNVFIPHLLATLLMRRYAPGTVTAVLMNLPISMLLLWYGFQEDYIRVSTFLWAGPLVVVLIMAVIPLLFAVGRYASEK